MMVGKLIAGEDNTSPVGLFKDICDEVVSAVILEELAQVMRKRIEFTESCLASTLRLPVVYVPGVFLVKIV